MAQPMKSGIPNTWHFSCRKQQDENTWDSDERTADCTVSCALLNKKLGNGQDRTAGGVCLKGFNGFHVPLLFYRYGMAVVGIVPKQPESSSGLIGFTLP